VHSNIEWSANSGKGVWASGGERGDSGGMLLKAVTGDW
jgi:hypothetical protein